MNIAATKTYFAQNDPPRPKTWCLTAMIAAGRIDNSISSVGFGLQKRRVVECPDDRLDIVGRNRAGLRLVTNQAANLMTRCDKGCCNCAADEAVRAGDEDLHFGSFLT